MKRVGILVASAVVLCGLSVAGLTVAPTRYAEWRACEDGGERYGYATEYRPLTRTCEAHVFGTDTSVYMPDVLREQREAQRPTSPPVAPVPDYGPAEGVDDLLGGVPVGPPEAERP